MMGLPGFGGAPKAAPLPPPPPPPAPPAPMPDPENVLSLAQNKRKVAAASQASGRLSTILSGGGGSGTPEKLGGG